MLLFFACLDEKQKLLEIFEKISKVLIWILLKCIIFAFFQKNLTNNALLFARLDEKRKLLGNYEKILKIFRENSLEKLNFYFIFYFIFIFIFRKFVTKNRAFGNNTIFLTPLDKCLGSIRPHFFKIV